MTGGTALSRTGLVSYGIYLMHMPVLSAVKKLTMNPVLVTLGTLAVVMPLAWLSFSLFEEPIRRLGRQRPRARDVAAARACPATDAAPARARPVAPGDLTPARRPVYGQPARTGPQMPDR